jgi:exodeoxyribonuclease VII small subunit
MPATDADVLKDAHGPCLQGRSGGQPRCPDARFAGTLVAVCVEPPRESNPASHERENVVKKRDESDATGELAPSFEQSLEKLERIVHELEDGQLGLSDSLARYEEGIKYLNLCYQELEKAERKIEILTGIDADGNPVTQPFDDRETTLEEKAARRSQRRSQRMPRVTGDEATDAAVEIDTPGTLF